MNNIIEPFVPVVKPYTESTLKQLTKQELVDYIKVLYCCFKSFDEALEQSINNNLQLSKALDSACVVLSHHNEMFYDECTYPKQLREDLLEVAKTNEEDE